MKKKKDYFHYPDHKLQSRRDFLASGLIKMMTLSATPSLLNLLSLRSAFGQCAPPSLSNKTAFICLDCAGGMNIAGSNVMVGKQGGQMDFLDAAAYSKLGLPASMTPQMPGQINTDLGIAFHSDSALLRGILETTSVATRRNIEGVIFAARSADDTGNNPFNPMYGIYRAGLDGQLVKNIGNSDSESGGRSAPAFFDPSVRPVKIDRSEDILSLVDTGRLSSLLSEDKAQKVMQAIQRLSSSRLAKFQSQDLPTQIRELVECGYIQSSDLIARFSSSAIDPRLDTIITDIFNVGNRNEEKAAAVAKMAIDGISGSGTITLGGFDYHNGTRTRGEEKDREAGQVLGKLFETAARKNKDLMVYLFSDGGIVSSGETDSTGKGVWRGDSGTRSAAVLFVYKRDGRPSIRIPGHQIGHYKDGSGAVETSATKISNNVTNMAMAVVANYMALHGEEGALRNAVGDHPFATDLDQYLFFERLR